MSALLVGAALGCQTGVGAASFVIETKSHKCIKNGIGLWPVAMSGRKHGKGVCFDVSVPLDPTVQQQVINKATAAVKRKQAEVAGLQEQLAEKKTTVAADLQAELKDLKRLRQAGTKAKNRRAVPIVSANQVDFDYGSCKKHALEHPTYGVEAAFRDNCAGSEKKALVLILELIDRLELR